VVARVLTVMGKPLRRYVIGLNAAGRFAVCTGECGTRRLLCSDEGTGQEACPTLFLLMAGAPGAAGELVRIPVAMVARGYKGKQKFAVTAADLAQIVKNFRKRGTGDLVIDYDHSTDFSAGTGEPVPAAGWLKAIEDVPDANGVLWGQAEFTERASKMLAAREYKYVSPVVVWGKRDKDSGEPQGTTVTSIALTNTPLLEKLPAIAFSDGWQEEIDRGDAANAGVKEKRVVKKLIMADRVARTVRVVADDDTESVVTLEGLEAAPKVITMSDVKRGAEGQYDFSSLETGGDVLIAGEVFRGVMVQRELDDAVKAGKITPAQRPFYEKLAASDLTGFRGLVATMKPAVDLTEHGIGGDGSGVSELTKLEASIDSKTRAKMKDNQGMQYHEALKLVASENPELDRRRTQLIREKGGDR
jgi:phage I-like protein